MKFQKGFTLVEIIIYVAIMGIVIVGLISFALAVSAARTKAYVGGEVEANARIALELIEQKIHAAQGFNSVSAGDPGSISLQMADPGKNPTVIDLDVDDGRMRIKEGASPAVYVTSHEVKVTNLTFTNLTQASEREHVSINLTVNYNANANIDYSYSWSGQSAVSVRQ